MIYFDNAATTPLDPRVLKAYTKFLESYGNPDSIHTLGRDVSRMVEKSRQMIAGLLGISPEEIIFTSGGSESNSMAVIGTALANRNRGNHIITSNAEHSSTKKAVEFLEDIGFEVTRLPIREDGTIHPEDLEKAMRDDTILVSLIHANNEMGAVNDLEALSAVVHRHPTALFHADCTQSFCKIDIPYRDLDLMTASAHKIHGLKGSGLLIKKKPVRMKALIQGGQQEQGLRGGTINAPSAAVLARTVRLALEEKDEAYRNARQIRDYLRDEIASMEGGHILADQDDFPFILNFALDSMTSEVLQNALDARGVYLSARSTCQSHSSERENPVLLAMGVSPRLASHAVRLSFSNQNTLEEAREFIQILREVQKQYGLKM